MYLYIQKYYIPVLFEENSNRSPAYCIQMIDYFKFHIYYNKQDNSMKIIKSTTDYIWEPQNTYNKNLHYYTFKIIDCIRYKNLR